MPAGRRLESHKTKNAPDRLHESVNGPVQWLTEGAFFLFLRHLLSLFLYHPNPMDQEKAQCHSKAP